MVTPYWMTKLWMSLSIVYLPGSQLVWLDSSSGLLCTCRQVAELDQPVTNVLFVWRGWLLVGGAELGLEINHYQQRHCPRHGVNQTWRSNRYYWSYCCSLIFLCEGSYLTMSICIWVWVPGCAKIYLFMFFKKYQLWVWSKNGSSANSQYILAFDATDPRLSS